MSSGIVEEESTDSSPSGDASSLGREFMIFKKLFRDLRLHTDVGLKLYNAKRKEMDERFYDVFYELNLAIDPLEQHQTSLAEGAGNYDFVAANGTRVRGNGYRSLLHLLKNLMQETVYQLQKSARERGGLFYSPADDLSSVTSYVRALQGLETILGHAVQLMENCKPPHLLEDGKMAENLKKVACTGDVARDVFYGRCLGFQYSSSLKPLLQIIAIGMASYDQWYRADKTDPVRRLLQSLWKGSKYLHRPTERGIKIADLTQFCSIPFTRAFWSIPEQESIKTALNFVGTNVDISENLEIPARNIVLQGLEGKEVTLSPPFSETGYRPIPVTLISHRIRVGQPSRGHGRKQQPLPPSPVLVVHFHGGGFVAQSPRSHEFYLRTWSRDLHCPILSVEYALSPENPFPRALEECVCAYAWALGNLDAMGCTGEKVVFVGDSAGGNLVISIAMKLKQLGLRLPNQIVSFYPTAVMRSSVTPSRFLSFADPLLPVGVLYSCLQAYAGNSPSDEAIAKVKDYRTKILRARGYIVPQLEEDENKSSPKLTRRLTDPSTLGQPKTLPSSGTDDGKRESAKVPPPRPPPPKSGSLGRSFSLDVNVDGSEPSKPNLTDLPASDTTTGEQQEERHSEELVEIALSSPQPGTRAKQPSQPAAQSPPQRPPPPSEESIMSASMARFMIRNEAGGRPKLGMKPPSREEQLSEEEIQRMTEEVMAIYADRESSKDPFMSPGLAPANSLRGLPPVHIVVGGLDPLMDDGVILAQHLQAAQQPVTLTVIDNLPHGFLSLTGVEELHVAHAKCLAVIKHALK